MPSYTWPIMRCDVELHRIHLHLFCHPCGNFTITVQWVGWSLQTCLSRGLDCSRWWVGPEVGDGGR